MSLVGNSIGRDKEEINEKEMKEKARTAFLPLMAPPTCLPEISPPKSQNLSHRMGPALLAASCVGVSFSVDETKENHYYCIYFIYEVHIQSVLFMRHKKPGGCFVFGAFLPLLLLH